MVVLMFCQKYIGQKLLESRDHFFAIRANSKTAADGGIVADERSEDKFRKIQQMLEQICRGSLKLKREDTCAANELSLTRVSSVKQFLIGKSNPEGLKNFICGTPKCLVLNFLNSTVETI